MTYCVGMRLDRGLIFMSDTRTNAGVDDVSQVRKMRHWENPGERAITLLSSGNLATTQAVVSLLDERSKAPAERDPSILSAPSGVTWSASSILFRQASLCPTAL